MLDEIPEFLKNLVLPIFERVQVNLTDIETRNYIGPNSATTEAS